MSRNALTAIVLAAFAALAAYAVCHGPKARSAMPSAKKSFYAVRSSPLGVEIVATDSEAKQTLWSWAGDYGSTRDPGAIELYGTSIGPWQGDETAWRWQLSKDGVRSARKSLEMQLEEPERFEATAKENACARELLAKLDEVGA